MTIASLSRLSITPAKAERNEARLSSSGGSGKGWISAESWPGRLPTEKLGSLSAASS